MLLSPIIEALPSSMSKKETERVLDPIFGAEEEAL